MVDIFGEEIHLQYEWKLDAILNNNPEIQQTLELPQDEINKLREKIIDIIQQLPNLIAVNSIVQEVQKVDLGNIGGRLYKLFIKQQEDKFLIHNSIGYLEEKK